MKQKTLLMVSFTILMSAAFAQNSSKKNSGAPAKKGQLFGMHFNIADFKGAQAFKASNNEGSTTTVKDLALGIGLSYWKGITSKIDFSMKLNGMFYDYAAKQYGQTGKTEIGLELEPTINVRPFSDANSWAPFLTAGAGIGMYTNHIGGYVPLGGGLQLNVGGTTYLIAQAQYRISLTKKVIPDHLFYSFGFAQSF